MFPGGTFSTPDDLKRIPGRIKALPYSAIGIGAGLGFTGGFGAAGLLGYKYPHLQTVFSTLPTLGAFGGGYLGYLADKYSASYSDLSPFINLGKKLISVKLHGTASESGGNPRRYD